MPSRTVKSCLFIIILFNTALDNSAAGSGRKVAKPGVRGWDENSFHMMTPKNRFDTKGGVGGCRISMH